MSVLSGQRKTGAQRVRRRCRGCDAFTEEVLSGWRSPPLPRLSARTQTAPEEDEEEEEVVVVVMVMGRMEGGKNRKKESVSAEQNRKAISG